MLLAGGVADAHRQANQGWQVVMSSPEVLYFDMPYAPDPMERGYDWASRGTDLFKVFAFLPDNLPANASLIQALDGKGATVADTVPLTQGHQMAGMQGQLWSESVRSDAIADYMLYPRVLALAERAWHRGNWEPAYVPGKSYTYNDDSIDHQALLGDWQDFQARTRLQLGALTRDGVAYRVPVPGARIRGGMLEANAAIAGLPIEYRTAGRWLSYTGPVPVSGPVEVRCLSPDGKRAGRAVKVQPPAA
jgi:hexosaminidase